jgi:hypothetical protein
VARAARTAAGGVVFATVWSQIFAGLGTVLGADAGPSLRFPTAPRERIAIASYPFREFIAGREEKSGGGKMELREFAAHENARSMARSF